MPNGPPVAFTNVSVRPMHDDILWPDRTVLVRDGRIAAIGPAGPLPPGTVTVDGTGKTLIPGLCDMHIHITATRMTDASAALDEHEAMRRSREYLFMFLCSGVTTVRNMAGTPLHLRLRHEVADGVTPGPRIFTAGPILETRFTWPGLKAIGELVRSPAEARERVLAHHQAGFDFIKVYNDIDAEIYDEIVRTSREVGLKLVGHVPFAKGLDGALAARQDSIEHLRSYDFAADVRPDAPGKRFEGWLYSSPARMAELAERTAAAGVWNVPTLVTEIGSVPDGVARPPPDLDGMPTWLAEMLATDTMQGVFTNEQRAAIRSGTTARLAMVGALDRAGAKLMPGSDCPVYGLVPGRSLLRELELFVQAGISPQRTLQSATIRSAEFLGIAEDAGTVAPGKRADLLLLDGDPIEDFGAIRRQAGVMAAGRWLPAAALHSTIEAFDRCPELA